MEKQDNLNDPSLNVWKWMWLFLQELPPEPFQTEQSRTQKKYCGGFRNWFSIELIIKIKKPRCLITFGRQPGYLIKTRGFPCPDFSGFGFFLHSLFNEYFLLHMQNDQNILTSRHQLLCRIFLSINIFNLLISWRYKLASICLNFLNFVIKLQISCQTEKIARNTARKISRWFFLCILQ